ncbi:MAG: Lrp/AsnC family transcriptional regulator [Candidatus Marinimicrobia bacterium]|nr:Lrp/AsnC family transcriptional regulator [Candidatus Neomarinimicrobiota bacterium]
MLDAVDVKILQILQENCKTQRTKIAEEVELTIPAVSERIKKLEKTGIIEGYHAKVKPHKLGKDIIAYVHIFYSQSNDYEYNHFLDSINNEEDIIECYSIAGDSSHIVKIYTKSTESLEYLLNRIQSWQGVEGTKTYVALSNFKDSTSIKPTKNLIK